MSEIFIRRSICCSLSVLITSKRSSEFLLDEGSEQLNVSCGRRHAPCAQQAPLRTPARQLRIRRRTRATRALYTLPPTPGALPAPALLGEKGSARDIERERIKARERASAGFWFAPPS